MPRTQHTPKLNLNTIITSQYETTLSSLPNLTPVYFLFMFFFFFLVLFSPFPLFSASKWYVQSESEREREGVLAYPISREHSLMMDNSNKWATGQQRVMKSYQQSIIIKSSECTSSTGKKHTRLTSLCISPPPVLAALKQHSSEPSLQHCASGCRICSNAYSGSITQTHASMFSLVCLIKVKDATILSSEPRGTWPNLLSVQRSNMLMRLHHILLWDDGL